MPENNSSIPIIWMKESGLHNYLTFKFQLVKTAFKLLVSFSCSVIQTIWHTVCVLYHGWINWDHQSYLNVQLLEFISINNEYTVLLYSEFRDILLYEKHFVLFIAMEILGLAQRMIHVGRLLRSSAVRYVFQLLPLSKGRKIFRW